MKPSNSRAWQLAGAIAALVGAGLAGNVSAQNAPANNPAETYDRPLTSTPLKDADNRTVYKTQNTGHVTNFYEEKVPPYKLPDVLKMQDGRPVTSAAMWQNERRPEILKLYRSELYGRVPDTAPKVRWEVTSTAPGAMNGTAIQKRLVGHMGEGPDAADMNVNMFLPASATGPVPAILTITFGGGPAGGRGGARGGPATGPATQARGSATAPAIAGARGARGVGAPPSGDPIADILARGWGYATIGYGDIEGDTYNTSITRARKLALKPGQTKPAPDEWGTVSAWAWGLSRIMDYFETDPAIDAKRVGIQGHSRLGRTVLWAGAQDPRFAVVFASCAGEVGSALTRRDFGETIDDMAQNFYWELAGNFQKYVGHWNDMPGDQHFIVALNAPHGLFLNGGTGDQWSDPVGEFLSAVAAGPVFKLLGKKDLGIDKLPPLDTPIIDGDIGWHYHTGGHAATPEDWKAFLTFAEKYLKQPVK